MVSSQFHYTKRNRFMPFLLAEILNFQGSTHQYGVGSFSKVNKQKFLLIKWKNIVKKRTLLRKNWAWIYRKIFYKSTKII